MDIFRYALQFEKDGEAFYRQSAEKIDDKNLADILLFLAREEQNHFRMINELKSAGEPRPFSIFISDIQNVFSRMKEKDEKFASEKSTVLAILNKALAIEDESIKYYESIKTKVTDDKAVRLLAILKKEEDAHYSLISSLIEYFDTPQLWLENAEFNHIKDY